MKKYRPYRAGFIVIYALTIGCLADSAFMLIRQLTNTATQYDSSFALFSYLIAVLAILYVKMYGASRVEINDKTMHIVNPVYIKPKTGEKRASFIYRQGDTDIKLLNKTFRLEDLEKFGYIEDLGYSQLDQSNAGQDNLLFPVHEVALVMKDGKRYHWNSGFYSWKQVKPIVEQIQSVSGIQATGELAKVVHYTEESVKQMKAERKAQKKAEAAKAKAKKGKKK